MEAILSHLRIATRGSALALWQARHVAAELERLHSGVSTELVRIKTTGDKILDVPLAKVGGKGLFTKEIEEALLEGRADLAVHSMKDVPAEVPAGLGIRAILQREDPRDAAATVTAGGLSSLPQNATIGTSSEDQMHIFFDPEFMLPAVAQGAIGVETRQDDRAVNRLVDILNHRDTADCVAAERGFLTRLEGGCQVPIAGLARLEGDCLYLEGLVGEVDGSVIIRRRISGPRTEGAALGISLAEEVLAAGGKAILDRLYAQN